MYKYSVVQLHNVSPEILHLTDLGKQKYLNAHTEETLRTTLEDRIETKEEAILYATQLYHSINEPNCLVVIYDWRRRIWYVV